VYSSKDSPFVIAPLYYTPLYFANLPDLSINMEEANSPSLHNSLFFSNFCEIAIEASLSFWLGVRYSI
jgi:hypothetical protein